MPWHAALNDSIMTDYKFVSAILAVLAVALVAIGIAGLFVSPTSSNCQSSGPTNCPAGAPNYAVAGLFLAIGCVALVPAVVVFFPTFLRRGKRAVRQQDS
jgi:hypothetical protein